MTGMIVKRGHNKRGNMCRRSILLLVILFALDGRTARCSSLNNVFRHPRGSRVLAGTSAVDGQFPYIVSLRWSNNHMCGGSILNKWWIVSAAHCVRADDGLPIPISEIVAGTVSPRNNGMAYPVDQIVIHPQYYSSIWLNDICLIKTREPIAFNDLVQPIRISMVDPQTVDQAIALGWGISDPQFFNGGPNSEVLQYSYVSMVDWQTCSPYYANSLTQDHTCTWAGAGTGTCFGDSGGPIVSTDGLIGITSRHYTPGCGIVPDAHIAVKNYVKWIDSIIMQ